MIHFKVIRASRLLFWIAVVALAAVACALLFAWLNAGGAPSVSPAARLVNAQPASPGSDGGVRAHSTEAAGSSPNAQDEAETALVFASSSSMELPLDPGPGEIEVEVLAAPTASPVPEARPSVLIYHTHTHEAYEQVSEDPYVALEAWRTEDADHSVVRVGEELARQLESLGFEVVHDITDHEGSDLSTAYTRSLATLEAYSRRFDLYIDLHRDAYVNGAPRCFTAADGVQTAQLMMLIGNGNGFDVKPYYAENFAFACALSDRINALEPGLCKRVLVKDGRYNQNIGVFALLVEVGHNRNTLAEALAAVPALAKGIASLMIDAPDAALTQMQRAYFKTRAARN